MGNSRAGFFVPASWRDAYRHQEHAVLKLEKPMSVRCCAQVLKGWRRWNGPSEVRLGATGTLSAATKLDRCFKVGGSGSQRPFFADSRTSMRRWRSLVAARSYGILIVRQTPTCDVGIGKTYWQDSRRTAAIGVCAI
jgi:hypothetical protein